MAFAQHENNRPNSPSYNKSDNWQSLRADLANLLDQVEGQVAQAQIHSSTPNYHSQENYTNHQTHSQNPHAQNPHAQNKKEGYFEGGEQGLSNKDVQIALSKINMLKRELEKHENNNLNNSKNNINETRYIQQETQHHSTNEQSTNYSEIINNISNRLNNFEHRMNNAKASLDMRGQSDNKYYENISAANHSNNSLTKISEQILQLTQVIELLSGAIGETGQVKRIESQIDEIANLISQSPRNNFSDINQRIENLTNNMQQLLELQALSTKSQKELEKNLINSNKASDNFSQVSEQVEKLSQNIQQLVELQTNATNSNDNKNIFQDNFSDLNKRIDELTNNIQQINNDEINKGFKEFNTTYENGVNSISQSIGNVYDRLDKIEKSSTFPKEIVERLFQEMTAITSQTALISQNIETGQLNNEAQDLISKINLLNDRLAHIENKDVNIGEINTDIISLKEMIKDAIEPRFFNLQSKVEDLNKYIENKDLLNGLNQQVQHLVGNSDNQKNSKNKLPEEVKSAIEQIQSVKKNDNNQSEHSKTSNEIFDEPTKTNNSAQKIDSRLSELKLNLNDYDFDNSSNNNTPKEDIHLKNSLPSINHDEINHQTLNKSSLEENIKKEEGEKVKTATHASKSTEITNNSNFIKAQETIEQIIQEPEQKTNKLEDIISRKKLVEPEPPMFLEEDNIEEDSAKTLSTNYNEELAKDFKQKSYLQKSYLKEKPQTANSKLPIDNNIISSSPKNDEAPAIPTSDFAPQMTASFDNSSNNDSKKIQNSTISNNINSSKNTFIEAARRAANRQVLEASDADDSKSLIGKAFARFQKETLKNEPDEKPSKADEKAMKKALKQAKKQTKTKDKNSTKTKDISQNEDNNSFIARYTKPVIISISLIIIVTVTLNLIINRPNQIPASNLLSNDTNIYPPATNPQSSNPTDITNDIERSTKTQPSTLEDQQETKNKPSVIVTGEASKTSLDTNKFSQPIPRIIDQNIEISKIDSANNETNIIDKINTASIPKIDIPTIDITKLEMPAEEIGPIELRKAAANGSAQAQFEVAAIYSEGKSLKQDFSSAAIWYERAAAQGFAPAGYRLGGLYENGQGVEKNLELAKLWYKRAAEAGNRMAMHNLASLYAGSDMGEPNFTLAIEWFERAAEQDLVDSQFNLGMLYARGLGTKQDLQTAYLWFSVAALNGDKDALKAKDDIARSLDSDIVASIQSLASKWKSDKINIAANFAPIGTWDKNFNPGKEIVNKKVTQKVQSILAALGYDVGTPDGLMGPRTSQAIKDFELETGMSLSGKINPRLLAVLGSQPV